MTIPVDWTLYINIGLGALLIVFMVFGYMRGFLEQLLDLFGLVAAFLVPRHFYKAVAARLAIWPKGSSSLEGTILENFFYERFNQGLWFVILFVACLIVVLLLKPLFKVVGEIPIIKEVNKSLGMIVSIILYGIWVSILVYILSTPLFINGNQIIENTALRPVREISSLAFREFSDLMEENEVISSIVSLENNEEVTQQQVDKIIEFFRNHGMKEGDIQETINKLLHRDKTNG